MWLGFYFWRFNWSLFSPDHANIIRGSILPPYSQEEKKLSSTPGWWHCKEALNLCLYGLSMQLQLSCQVRNVWSVAKNFFQINHSCIETVCCCCCCCRCTLDKHWWVSLWKGEGGGGEAKLQSHSKAQKNFCNVNKAKKWTSSKQKSFFLPEFCWDFKNNVWTWHLTLYPFFDLFEALRNLTLMKKARALKNQMSLQR